MKKISILIITTALLFCFCINTSADNEIIKLDNVDVIFDATSDLSFEDKQIIAELLVRGNSDIQTYGLICNIFGHKNTTEYVTTVTHCVNSTVPRCLEETWEIIVCSRCDNTETNRLGHAYINCCPVD